MAKRMMNEILAAVVAGEQISDAEIRDASYAIEDYEITVGDMSQKWHTCTKDQLPAYINAHANLRSRLAALKTPKPVVDQVAVDMTTEIAALEARAQDADDGEQHSKSGALRARARELRTKLSARLAGGAS